MGATLAKVMRNGRGLFVKPGAQVECYDFVVSGVGDGVTTENIRISGDIFAAAKKLRDGKSIRAALLLNNPGSFFYSQSELANVCYHIDQESVGSENPSGRMSMQFWMYNNFDESFELGTLSVQLGADGTAVFY